MDDQNKNLILATVLSFLVILGWFVVGPMLFPQWFPTETTAPTLTALPADTPATAPAATETAPESLESNAAAEKEKTGQDRGEHQNRLSPSSAVARPF